ncbi:unnamed protein product [Camellia sinensis]
MMSTAARGFCQHRLLRTNKELLAGYYPIITYVGTKNPLV